MRRAASSIDLDSLRGRRADILRVARGRGASNIRVFGSAARGQATPTSDLDLLVSIEPGRTLLDLVGLERELAELLQVDVDVLSDRAVHPSLMASIAADSVAL